MVLLRLLAFTLVSSYFHPGTEVDAQQDFTIRSIVLSIEPSTDVTRDTNVTVRCKATVSSSGQEALSREYTIFKDSNKVYTKTSSTAEDLLYLLPDARVSNSGKYKCKINIEGKEMTSDAAKLTVTGLSKPVLLLHKDVVSEGEEVTARCTAPGETGSIYFNFYEDSKGILDSMVNSNQMDGKLRFRNVGTHKIHCAYAVLVMPETFKSVESNTVTVLVKELSITPVLEIYPQSKVYEGDRLSVTCSVRNALYGSENAPVDLYLSHGTKLLSRGNNKVNHTMVALAEEQGDFECKLEKGNVAKVTTKIVPVTELFSSPTLAVFPADVFQREHMSLSCKSESFASERINEEDLTYTLEPPDGLISTKPGVFSGKALVHDFNYTCVAQAKGIKKRSGTLTVRPKVAVSRPKISVVGRAVLGQPVKIRCLSDSGSFPINYTLLRIYDPVGTSTVRLPTQDAVFTVTIDKPEEISKYMCEAKNKHAPGAPLSRRLNATLIEPLRDLTLTVLPDLSEISEGNQLYLICGTKGTPPITYRIYRVGDKLPVFKTISNHNNTSYRVNKLSKEHGGTYYCEADNHANLIRSEKVVVEVRMALWKKAVIGGVCLLVASVLVAVCVLYVKSKRVRVVRTAVSVWSERPPEADKDEEDVSSVMSSEPDVEYTEVVHPQPADTARAVPPRKGTDTVYSELKNLPPGAADRHDHGSLEYAELNGERPEISPRPPEVNDYHDLPEPVD